MELWKFENNPMAQTALAWLCVGVGLALMYYGRQFGASGSTNILAGFLLGVLLLIVGVAAFLSRGKQTVVIDPERGSITVTDDNAWGTKKRTIAFGDIAGTGIGFLGKRMNFFRFYYIVLTLRDGEEYSLFAPGRFYAGGFDRDVMETRRQRLEQWLR